MALTRLLVRGPFLGRTFRQGIGPRLLGLIVLFSSVVTLVATLTQLFIDYRHDISAIEGRLAEIERSNLGSLATSLWNVDRVQLQLQLDGLLRLPDMQLLEVRETAQVGRPLVVTAGQPGGGAKLSRSLTLIYDDRGERREIGVLQVEATLETVYDRLIERGVVIAISQGLKTFLVSLFTLYIVHRLVTRHLVEIARRLDADHAGEQGPPLCLTRTAPHAPDELDRVVGAFNALRARLQRAYNDLRDTNEALERDIIARKAAEAEVLRLNQGLEQRVRQRTAELELANRELSSFTYSVSHDLRAPLRRIAGFAQMLGESLGEQLSSQCQHYLNRIQAGATDMQEMVDSFLQLARAAQVEQVVERFDMSRMANEIFTDMREKDPDRTLSIFIEPGLTAQGDRRLFRNALENLLNNAWKYTRNTEQPEISLTTARLDNQIVYVVRDNGAGFDQHHADRLFIPFKRLHRKGEFEGTGIGLATVQRIISRHGGRVWAEGEAGKGAAFMFTLWENEPIL